MILQVSAFAVGFAGGSTLFGLIVDKTGGAI